jgi:hypothetical protein
MRIYEVLSGWPARLLSQAELVASALPPRVYVARWRVGAFARRVDALEGVRPVAGQPARPGRRSCRPAISGKELPYLGDQLSSERSLSLRLLFVREEIAMPRVFASALVCALAAPVVLLALALPRGCGTAALPSDRQRQFDHCRAVLAGLPRGDLTRPRVVTLADEDLWGRPLRLTVAPVEEPGFLAVTVRSPGPDSVFDTDDDVVATEYVRLP